MAVASFSGPDQPHIKDSSDIQISFYIVLSDFFSRKTLVVWLQAHGTTTTVELAGSLFISSQKSWITVLQQAEKLIIGFLWW